MSDFSKRLLLILSLTFIIILYMIPILKSRNNPNSVIGSAAIIKSKTAEVISQPVVFAKSTLKSEEASKLSPKNPIIKPRPKTGPSGIICYRTKAKSLPNIEDYPVRKGKTIFFLETSCRSHENDMITLLPRQACAIESAALMNPEYDVTVLFASPGALNLDGEGDLEMEAVIKALLIYDNVRLFHVDYGRFTRNSPVQELYERGDIEASKYPKIHASDVLRYLTLWKYGGIYLDLDVVVIRSFADLPPNFSGAESDRNVANGVMGFSADGIGHKMALSCLNDLKLKFNGKDWGFNGPGVITRLARILCREQLAINMEKKTCLGYKVFPPEYFYPVPWVNWSMYFKEEFIDEVAERTKKSYAIHVWNKHSMNKYLPVHSRAPYVIFAKKFCPNVFRQIKEIF